MEHHIAKKPPCEWCKEGIPHGGGVIRTATITRFPPLGIDIEMPFCNYPGGRNPDEIIDSIITANPDIQSALEIIRERVRDHLETGRYQFRSG